MNRKLKEYHVARIKQLYAKGLTQVHIAEAFRIDQSVVSDIVRGESWESVKPARDDFQTHTLANPVRGEVSEAYRVRIFLDKWVRYRTAIASVRSGQLVFSYNPETLMVFHSKESKNRKGFKAKVAVREDGVTIRTIRDQDDPISGVAQVRSTRAKIHAKPLPSDQLCWALTFEISLKQALYPSERKMLAAWYRDATGETPIPSRAARKLLQECKRRRLR